MISLNTNHINNHNTVLQKKRIVAFCKFIACSIKTMGRKNYKYTNRHERSRGNSSERESLLNPSSTEDFDLSNKNKTTKTSAKTSNNNFNLNIPSSKQQQSDDEVQQTPRRLPERKKSAWAPVATATVFEDVPVFTICPYCSSKTVTKTQFRRGKKHW